MAVLRIPDRAAIGELWRFYQAAVVNTAFGYGVFALFVWLGLDKYLAQIIAQILGMTFNYFTYSRHVFRDRQRSIPRFIGAYVLNYGINLAFLALFDLFVRSPYVAGLFATICASLVNYLILKFIVFARPEAAS